MKWLRFGLFNKKPNEFMIINWSLILPNITSTFGQILPILQKMVVNRILKIKLYRKTR
jgi:hypothetical protein